jgi:hypothetical protein
MWRESFMADSVLDHLQWLQSFSCALANTQRHAYGRPADVILSDDPVRERIDIVREGIWGGATSAAGEMGTAKPQR